MEFHFKISKLPSQVSILKKVTYPIYHLVIPTFDIYLSLTTPVLVTYVIYTSLIPTLNILNISNFDTELIIPTWNILVLDGARAGPAQSEPSDGLKAAQHEVEQLVVVTLSAHVFLDHREGVVNDGHEHVGQHEHHDQDEAEEEDGRQHGLHGGELLVVERPQGERQERLEGRQEGAVGREPPPEHQQGELGVGADDDDEDDREGGHVLGRVAQGGRQHGDAPVKAQDVDEFDG